MARLRKCRFCLKINRRSIEINAKTVQGMDLLASWIEDEIHKMFQKEDI